MEPKAMIRHTPMMDPHQAINLLRISRCSLVSLFSSSMFFYFPLTSDYVSKCLRAPRQIARDHHQGQIQERVKKERPRRFAFPAFQKSPGEQRHDAGEE